MHRTLGIVLLGFCVSAWAGEEKIRGLLEKTTHPGACAQITDALADVYYIVKSDEAEKAVAKYAGKTEKVVVAGTVETKEGDPAYFLNLKSVEPYAPKLPPPPPPPVLSNASAIGILGQPFNYQIAATEHPTAYDAAGLPGGLAVNPNTGAISGTPTATGTFTVTVKATNAGGTGSGALTITVNPAAPPVPPAAEAKAEAKAEPKTGEAKPAVKEEPKAAPKTEAKPATKEEPKAAPKTEAKTETK
ncbi:MAG: Ig domain-containing protein [Planctomycetota bacterium]